MVLQLDEVISKYKDKPVIYTILERNFLDFWSDSMSGSDANSINKIECTFKRIMENLTDEDYRVVAIADISRKNVFKGLGGDTKPRSLTLIAFALIRLYIKDSQFAKQLSLCIKSEIEIDDYEEVTFDMMKRISEGFEEDEPAFMLLNSLINIGGIFKEVVYGTTDERLIAKRTKEIRGLLASQMLKLIIEFCNEFVVDEKKKSDDRVNEVKKLLKERKSAIKSLEKENKQLKKDVSVLNNKLERLSTKEEQVVVTYEKEYEEARQEAFVLQNKLSNVQERLHYIESSMSNNKEVEDLIELQKAIEEEQDSFFNIDNYKIVVVGDSSRLKLNTQFILFDHMKQPNGIGKCDNADAVILLTNYMTHSSFFAVRNYCKRFGINLRYCSIAGTNMNTIETAIRHEVVNLLK